MKTPRFEEQAKQWRGKADFYIIYSREAHPKGKGMEHLSRAARRVMAMDADGDHRVTRAEFTGPDGMFAPFDVNGDGVVHSHELISAYKVEQYVDFAAPTTDDERLAAARRFRDQIPGKIPVLIDSLDNATSLAYGRRPNSAFIIGTDGRVAHKMEWASTRGVETAIAALLGERPPPRLAAELDWSVVAASVKTAKESGKPLLIQFTATGCTACEAMKTGTLADGEIQRAIEGFQVVELGVERDEAWALFETLELSATPAFVIVETTGAAPKVHRRVQGMQRPADFLGFLDPAT